MPTVRLSYEGSIDVVIHADPDDAEAWATALAQAWADAVDSSPRAVLEAAELTSDALVCDECGHDDACVGAHIQPVAENGATRWLCADCRAT